jgi:glycosyltransferase involved in cell wall biosynthesis
MRIMEIVSGTAVNGAAVNCRDVTRELANRGHELTLVCRPGAWIAEQFAGTSVRVVESGLRRWPLDDLRQIAGEVRAQDIQVVHTHMSSANFFGVLLRRFYGIPACVATAHNRYLQPHWMFNDRVIAVSEATRAFHRRVNLVSDRRIDVIHNFIDVDRFARPAKQQRARLRNELGIGDGELLVGIVGDVIPRKGMIYLIQALPRIARAVPQVKLLSVGHPQPEYARQVQAAVEAGGVADRVIWGGPSDNIDGVLQAIDLYVLPSLEESLPLSILEAMASGRAVVASAVGGVPECVDDGRTGRLVRPGQADSLAEAIIELLSDRERREAFGYAGQRLAAERFSIASQIPQIERIFAQLVA